MREPPGSIAAAVVTRRPLISSRGALWPWPSVRAGSPCSARVHRDIARCVKLSLAARIVHVADLTKDGPLTPALITNVTVNTK